MEISKQQLKVILQNAPIGTNDRQLVEGLIKKGYNIEGLDPMTASVFRETQKQPEALAGNQFTQEEPKTLWGKARDIAAKIVGGGSLARGAGLALAAPAVQNSIDDTLTNLVNTQTDLLSRLKEQRANGEDTKKTVDLLKLNQLDLQRIGDTAGDFAGTLPSNREVVGSAVRLAGTLAAPTIAGQAVKGSALGAGVTGVGSGVARGAATGAIAGGVEGSIQGLGAGIEDGGDLSDIAQSTATGAGAGALGGGVLGGAIGGVTGAVAGRAAKLKSYVTPEASELTPRQYRQLLAQGRVTPKTATNPAQVILTEGEERVAQKYTNVISKDPVKTYINIGDQISDLDDQVGAFLQSKNGIYNTGELKNTLTKALDDIDDITVPEERLQKAKETLVNQFVEAVEKNDMLSLWKARKNFDRTIEKAFSGSPSVQKDMKIAFRNSIQDFISERTGDGVYKGYMSDMSNLFKLQDTVGLKAAKERSLDMIRKWAKNNPGKAKAIAIGFGSALYIGNKIFSPFSSGGSGD